MIPECAAYLERINNIRGQIVDLITGLPAEALNWRPVEGQDDHATNSLAVIAAHVAGAEHFWMHEIIGRNSPTRVREEEFHTAVEDPGPLLEKFRQAGDQTRAVLSALTAEEVNGTRKANGRSVKVRWAILHVIDHSSLHLGHMQLTLQLWQGGKGVDAPRWFQRLNG